VCNVTDIVRCVRVCVFVCVLTVSLSDKVRVEELKRENDCACDDAFFRFTNLLKQTLWNFEIPLIINRQLGQLYNTYNQI